MNFALAIELLVVMVLLFQILRRLKKMSTDPLAPITQANNDLTTSVAALTKAIQDNTRAILLAVRELKNPTTPTGEIGGLATQIETAAKNISTAAASLETSATNLTGVTGAAPTSIVATPSPIALDLNGAPTQQLSVIDSDSDDITSDPSTVYSSDTPGVATVNATGSVTGVAVGSFNVSVTDEFDNTTTVPGTVVDSSQTGGAAPAAQAKKKA